jgi:hypothetical protein
LGASTGTEAVFLDTNIWIDMADGKKAEAQPLKHRLTEMVSAGEIFCPLSPPLIWELYLQEYSRVRTGELMEALSLNVCYSPTKEIFDGSIPKKG